MKDNKGFSLVELVVAIAIASIVGLVMTVLVLTSYKSYNVNMSMTSLQQSSQSVSNIIYNLLLNTTTEVKYAYDVDGTDEYITSDEELPAYVTIKKKAILKSDNEEYRIVWNSETREITCECYRDDALILSEHIAKRVENFSFDLRNLPRNRVSYSIQFYDADNEVTFTSEKTVALRNKVQ